jgi:uncharacterized RDD family membrane protein YckC
VRSPPAPLVAHEQDNAVQNEYWEDYEVLTVETPENLLLRLPLAGFGPRLIAVLLDTLFSSIEISVIGIVLFMLIIGVSATASTLDPAIMLVLFVAVVILGLVLVSGYFIIFESLWNGQTPGKRIAGIRVIKRGGQPLEFRDVFMRNLLRIVDYLPTNGLTGLVCFFVSKYQQRLGDLVADTVVVREFSNQHPFTWAGAGPVELPGGQIGPRLSYVISNYLQRVDQLPVEVRLELTDRIIRQLGYNPGPLSMSERDSYLASLMQTAYGGMR